MTRDQWYSGDERHLQLGLLLKSGSVLEQALQVLQRDARVPGTTSNDPVELALLLKKKEGWQQALDELVKLAMPQTAAKRLPPDWK